MNKDSILIGATIAILGILFMAANVPDVPSTFSKDITIDGNLNVTGRGEFGDNVNITGNYILEFPMESWIHMDLVGGVTNVELSSLPSGTYDQDRHYAKLHVSVGTAPGAGKFVNVTLTDGTNEVTVSITNAEKSGFSTINAFDLDVSTEALTLKYSQTAGGASDEACIMIHWWYKENA